VTYDRIVIGGGFAGLLDAYRSTQEGEEVLLLEASDTFGGVLRGVHLGGLWVDGGAEAFSVVEPVALNLVEECGLSDLLVRPEPAPAHIIGPEHTTTIPHGIFGIPSSLDDPIVRQAVGGEAVEQARQRDAGPLPGSWAEQSLADIVRSRLGPTFVTHLVDPVVTGVHGAGSEDLDAHFLFPRAIEAITVSGSLVEGIARTRANQPTPGSAVASLRGGLFSLVSRLIEILLVEGVTLQLQSRVTRIFSSRSGWEVQTGSTTHRAKWLTLACGPQVQLELLDQALGYRPTLPPGSVMDSDVVLGVVGSRQLDSHPLGSGALVSEHRHPTVKSTTHVNAKWRWVNNELDDNTHIIRLSVRSGSGALSTPRRVMESALTELYGATDADVVEATHLAWPGSLVRPHRGHKKWLESQRSSWESAGVSVRGALSSGNGLLGISRDETRSSST
jgi:protoporphyrinogen/coproporphyrinogen III oxidase